jgi:general secretion pathway protein L
MARILGLDLGSDSVKAVVVDTSQRAQPIAGYAQVPRGDGERWATLRQALTQLTSSTGPVDQVVVALPGPALATHVFSLPFSDPKRLEAALPFEVEGQLPFDLAEAVFDYQAVGHSGGKTDVWVGVVKKDDLTHLLALLAELDLDPRIVTHPAAVAQCLWMHAPEPSGPPLVLLDLGHERSSLSVILPTGELEMARTFAGGGRDLTRALAQELKLSFADAQRLKEQGPLDERARTVVHRALQPMLREVRATLKAYAARTHRQVARLVLTGGTSRLEGLPEQLTQDLGLPTELWAAPVPFAERVPEGAATVAAQAYALALRGQLPNARAPRLNLRRGELAFKGHYDYLRERAQRLILYAAALVFLFAAFGVVRNSTLSSREQAVDDQLCRLTKQVLGKCDRNYDRALNMLKGKESPGAAVPKLSATDVLAELTQRIPQDATVTFDQLLVDPERVTLRGITDSSRQVDRIKDALRGFRCFHEIQVGKLEKTKDERVTFRLEIQVECPELPTQASAG